MPNTDLKNTPLFVFVRRQGERVVHYTRKVSGATGPYLRRARRYWQNARMLSSLKARFRAQQEGVSEVEAPRGDWNEAPAMPPIATDFMQAILQRSLSPRLHALLGLRSAVRIACVATIEAKAEECAKYGWSAEQISAVLDGASHPTFTAGENLLLQYADDVTRTPIDVDLQVFRRLRQHFTQEQIAEATSSICYENFRTRYNNAIGSATPLTAGEVESVRGTLQQVEARELAATTGKHFWESLPH
jgi:alkylhydroperoxidase family enzyme